KKGNWHLLQETWIIYQFMADHNDEFPIEKMSVTFGVSRSGYYRWLTAPPSQRSLENQTLMKKILHHWNESDERYGSPRIYQELCREDIQCSRPRVARLMRKMGIASRPARPSSSL
ncbi:MAG: IS3 family transposase, partial [Candidatus Paceibacterota bacterium]